MSGSSEIGQSHHEELAGANSRRHFRASQSSSIGVASCSFVFNQLDPLLDCLIGIASGVKWIVHPFESKSVC